MMRERWAQAGGYREVLIIAGPLILSMGSWSLMHFIDRMFLTWYDQQALAAALPAGLLSFALSSFFFGTAGYVNTFVAQYHGAGRNHRVGAAVWQGIYFSLAAGILMLAFVPLADWIFETSGHAEQIRPLEVIYFQILTGWVWSAFLMSSCSTFFTGRGDTWTVMWVNVLAVVVNIALDYAWIFGYWGFPRLGIEGAARATVVAQILGAAVFLALIFRKRFRENYHTLRKWRLDTQLLLRILRFGAPNGVQMMVEILGLSVFVLLVGKLGTLELAATNLTFNINTLAFLPMLGLGVAVSTLVGRHLGEDHAHIAERSTWSALHLGVAYMGMMALSYVVIPGVFLKPFASGTDPVTFAPLREMTVALLKFVAFYCVFDAIYIVFSAAVKGAGDTRFVMWTILVLSVGIMVVPAYLAVAVFAQGIYWAWVCVSAYIALIGSAFYLRFRGGKWKAMRVIEQEGVSLIAGREAAEVSVREHTDVM